MSLTSDLPINVMALIVNKLDTKDFVNMQSVCKHWHALLQSDQVISIIMRRVFPHYSVRPEISLMHQFRQLHLVPQNIANGIYSIEDVKIPKTSDCEYDSPTHHIEILYDTSMIVTSRKTGDSLLCIGHSESPSVLLNPVKITDLQFTLDGTKMVTASTDSTLKVWDLATGKCLHTLEGHMQEVMGVRIDPTGSRACSFTGGLTSSVVKWWNLETGACIHTFVLGGKGHLELSTGQNAVHVFVSRNQTQIYTQNESETLSLNTINKQVLSTVKTPDDKQIIASTPDSLLLLDSNSLEVLKELPFPEGIEHRAADGILHRTWITWMRFSLDGTKLILRGHNVMHGSLHPFANVMNFLKLDQAAE